MYGERICSTGENSFENSYDAYFYELFSIILETRKFKKLYALPFRVLQFRNYNFPIIPVKCVKEMKLSVIEFLYK